jgi:hypothetical protein
MLLLEKRKVVSGNGLHKSALTSGPEAPEWDA